MSALAILSAAVAATQAAAQTGAAPTPTPQPTQSTRKAGETDYVDVEAGAGYATNPFLAFGSDTGRAFGRFSVHAVHARVSERSTTLISAYGQDATYFGRYGSQESFALDARHDTAVSEHVRLFFDASGSFDKGGQLGTRIIGVPVVPPIPGGVETPPVLVSPGADFVSITGRTYRVAAHGGATFALSARDDLTVSAGAEHVVFRGFAHTDYTTIPVSLAYDRQLSPRSTVGARVVFQNTDYNGPSSTRVITPEVTGRVQLAERLILNGAVGASFASIDDGIRTTHSTGLSAQANLCDQGEMSSLCARISTDEQAATVAGPARVVSGGVDYSRRLDADSTVDLSASLDHYSSPISVIAGRTFSSSTYYRVAADYARRISNRWFAGVNLAGRKLAETGPDPKADLSASLFIRYRFGDLQ